jgi:hypothetical protein
MGTDLIIMIGYLHTSGRRYHVGKPGVLRA